MNGDDRPDPYQDLWRRQGSEQLRMSIEEIHMRVERSERRVRRRTVIGFINCAFLVVFFGWWWGTSANHVEQTGAALIVAAVAYIGWDVVRSRSRLSATDQTADHIRAELLRQRDFHSGSRLASRVLFLLVAAMVFFTGFAMAHPEVRRTIQWEAAAGVVLMIAAIPLNLYFAAGYQREIDRVDRLEGESR